MSLDKAIKHGKEKRKPFLKAKGYHEHCRNHHSCDRCSGNRLFQRTKQIQASRDALKEEGDICEAYAWAPRLISYEQEERCAQYISDQGYKVQRITFGYGWAGMSDKLFGSDNLLHFENIAIAIIALPKSNG